MTTTGKITKEELEKLLEKAIRKVAGAKENDLCKYLPGPTGGYMHHFTMRKLKNSDPEQLFKLIEEHIVQAATPHALDPKPRAPRGSRKRRDFISFSRTDIEKVLELARKTGDTDLLARFSPKRSLPALKKELVRSIRANQICPELWNSYVESITTLQNAPSLFGDDE
ncbi:MAG: hypothetical protein S4CHLAM81_07450 [Chlamydiales bacterium]|nr:hypothetical protein [Chlamydiales bacterium]MCH9635528.1 hypothetical protein [Chlamydiales bacterium]MCH9703737.1 hypothetical protein [Chlamydiota bacterium]